MRSADAAIRPGAGLTIEGQDLLMALKRFAGSLVHSPNGQQMDQQSPGNLDQTQGVSSRRGSPAMGSYSSDVVKSNIAEAINQDDLDIVGFDISGEVQLIEGWDAHTWESSGLGLIVTGEC